MITNLARVGDISDQIRGVSYGKSDAISNAEVGYLPVLRAGNITESGLAFDDLVYVPAVRVSARQRIRNGDVVIAASSGSLDVVGKAAMARFDYDGGFGAFCKVLRPNTAKVDAAYFGHYFHTREYRQTISSLAAGANINNLKNQHLDDLLIPLPPLPEQRRIAAILDQADILRAKRREALAQLDKLQQAIFIETFGDPATNPKGWPITTVGDLLKSASYGTSEKSASSGEFPVLRMNNITRTGEFDLSDLKYMDLADSEHERYLVKTGDVLFNRTNSAELVGKTAIFREKIPMAYAGYLIRLRTNESNDPEYLSGFMNTAYAKRILRGMCKSIIGMANINATEVQSIKLAKPPLKLQTQYRQRIGALLQVKACYRASLTELDSLFSSLQHRAFRGEL